MKIGSPVGVKELNEEQLDQMARGSLEANTPHDTDGFDQSFDTIISLPMVITDEGLGDIIDIHYQQKYHKLEEGETPRSVRNKVGGSYRCNVNPGHDITVLKEPEMTRVLDIMNCVLPDMQDFGAIVHGVIHHFTTGHYIDFRKETEDMRDSATCFLTLNDTFRGGRFSIDPGCDFDLPRGSFLGFNNCTTVLYNMEPIYFGERYLLQLYFQRPTEQDIETLTRE
tara:strand:- start:1213 stop:1887 length:675 start_codon:yes stop_codon:yes gene_type:complete